MQHFVSAMLLVVATIHLLPVVGLTGAKRLESLYGVAIEDPNLLILMRHRAALFGLVGGLMVLAAFSHSYQNIAFAAGFVSVLSFMWLAWPIGESNAQVQRVFTADIIALVCLVTGCLARMYMHFRSNT